MAEDSDDTTDKDTGDQASADATSENADAASENADAAAEQEDAAAGSSNASEGNSGDNEGDHGDAGETYGSDYIAALDPTLLSMMTGELATPDAIRHKCQQIQLALAQVLMVLFKDKNDIHVEASSGTLSHGPRSELLGAVEGHFTYCDASIEKWSDDIAIYCTNDLIIAMVECLLGGDDPDNIEPVLRELSDLELSLSGFVFEIVNEGLKATITRNPKLEDKLETPSSQTPDADDETFQEYHAVDFSIQVTFGKLESHIHVIVPQSNIIKVDTKTVAARRRKDESTREWTEKLSKQVYNSDILLQANIGLETMRLNEIGRLQVGDVLRFGEEGDPTVVLKANGHDLYNCALGKSGNKYMVKVTEPVGDGDWKKSL